MNNISLDSTLDRIRSLSRFDRKNALEKCIKIQEEVGELSAEILKIRGKKGAKGLKKPQLEENLLEECCDVLIITYSLMHKLRFSKQRIANALNKKLDKAELNIPKQKLWKKQI